MTAFKGLQIKAKNSKKMSKTQKKIFKRIIDIIYKYSKKVIVNTLSYIYNIFVKVESELIEDVEKIFINSLVNLDLNNNAHIPYNNQIDNRKFRYQCYDGGRLDNLLIISCIYHNQKYRNIHINSFVDLTRDKNLSLFF